MEFAFGLLRGVFGSCGLMQTVASKKGEPGSTSGAGRVCRETNRRMCRRLLAVDLIWNESQLLCFLSQRWVSVQIEPLSIRRRSRRQLGSDRLYPELFFSVSFNKRTFSKPVEYFNSNSTGSALDASADLVFSRWFGNLVLFVLSSLIERSPQ